MQSKAGAGKKEHHSSHLAASSTENTTDEELIETKRFSNMFPPDDSYFLFKHSVDMSLIDFDDMLLLLGEFGRAQISLFLCMIPFTVFFAFVYFGQMFITLLPEKYWCNVPQLNELTLEERMALSIPMVNGEFSKCEMYDVNYTEILNQDLKSADPEWPIVACQHGWTYDFSDIPYETITTEQNWVCKDSALPTYAQSLFFVGAMLGGLIFGWIADRYGRIPALVSCNLCGFVGGLGTAFVQNFWQFCVMRFFVGFAFDNCFTMMYILVLEYIGPNYRTCVGNMSLGIFYTLASCMMPVIAYYLANWRLFTIVISVPLALSVFTPCIVPESARWLVSQGRIKRAIKILKKLEKINGANIPDVTYEKFWDSCRRFSQQEHLFETYTIFDLFKTPRLRRITIIMIIIWMSISIVFDGHCRIVTSLGLDFFYIFIISCATEFPADTFVSLVLDIWGRRWLSFGSMATSGVCSLIAATMPLGILLAVPATFGRLFVNVAYNIGLQYSAEVLPTVVRAQGVALIHILGYLAMIVAPMIVYLASISTVLPMIILGVLGLLGGVLSLFIPETLYMDLPQTLDDGELFGIDQGFWDFPCTRIIEPHEPKTHQTGARLISNSQAEIRSSLLQRSFTRRNSLKPG